MKNLVFRSVYGRGIATTLIVAQVLISVPASALAAPVNTGSPEIEQRKPPAAPTVTVNRTRPVVTPPPSEPQFSARPTTAEITRARVFDEPLLPLGNQPTPEENAALARALLRVHRSDATDWRSPLTEFLMQHPSSPWRPSLLGNLGTLHLREYGYSRALQVWDEAWTAAKDYTDAPGRAVADSALAQWLALSASFGLTEQVEARLATVQERSFSGAASVTIARARETAALIKQYPDRTLMCGPEALLALLEATEGSRVALPAFLTSYPADARGTSLDTLVSLAGRAGLELQAMARTIARSLPVPSIVHLKVGHFVTVVAREGERYQMRDRSRGQTYWVSRDTLLEEMSGYVLMGIADTAVEGWRTVEAAEARTISGRGPLCPDGSQGPPPPPPPPPPQKPCRTGAGMPEYSLQPTTTSLVLEDLPVLCTPPRGPAAPLRISYHQRDMTQPQTFTFMNMGPKWSMHWIRYVKEVPMDAFGITPAHVEVILPPGSIESHVSPNAQGVHPPHWSSRAVVARVSTSPLRYERRLPNGTVEVYAWADGAPAGNRRVFLSELIDRAGQRLQFTWDSQLRLVAITDAVGQVTTFDYTHPTDPLKLTTITDPYGRSASFTYTEAGQLASATDVLGLTSRFTYATDDFISAMTTPYGTTSFRHEPNGLNTANLRYIEATDPLGATERLEFQYSTPSLDAAASASEVPSGLAGWNNYLNRYNSFYWSKRAYALGKDDLTKATITHWMVGAEWPGWQKYSYVPHSIKQPLENRLWFQYPGQTAGNEDEINGSAQPSRVARVLDDGTTQASTYTYNVQGQVLTASDPLGRQQTYTYDADGLDVVQVRQTTAGLNDVLGTWADFTSGHKPQTITDAAGQSTSLTYNAAGQVVTVTNATNETTTVAYDADGRVTSVTGAVPSAVTSITYDAYGRPRTVTGPDGYQTVTDYDVFDRPTRVTYTDGTYEAWSYDRLDLATARDRAGRVTRYYYDALRRLTATRDPLGRVVAQEWCGCGALEAIVDANGNRTVWERDLQSRVTREVRANGSAMVYTYEVSTSRVKQRTDAKGQQTHYTYFADDAQAQVSYTNATVTTPSVSWTV